MKTPLQVVFHGMDHSSAVETRIMDEAKKLEQNYSDMTSMRVAIEAPHKSQSKGSLYDVAINLAVPGDTLIAKTKPADKTHEDVYIAVRDAFAVLARQLRERHAKLNSHR